MLLKRKNKLFVGILLLLAFGVWTWLLGIVDVRQIGPDGSSVGFATINEFFHSLTGVNMSLYIITDWLGLVPVAVCLAFAVMGLVEWIKRKKILLVDKSILVLGIFYLVVIAVYVLFEYVVINRRPVLIDGYLEASYPSSTTMLVMCVMPTAAMQLSARIKDRFLRGIVVALIIAFIAFMVIGRLLSGVHWLSDIIGGTLVSSGLVLLYDSFAGQEKIDSFT